MTFKVQGLILQLPVDCLIDSGASISLVSRHILNTHQLGSISSLELPLALGANGSPLSVMGKVELPIRLGSFHSKHVFVVVEKLVVDCILGADFLFNHGAILDCAHQTLQLCKRGRAPSHIVLSGAVFKPKRRDCFDVRVRDDVVVEGRHVMYISAELQTGQDQVTHAIHEGLVEPLDSTSIPSHILCARSLSCVDSQHCLLVEVINGSPEPIKLYKGTKIAQFYSMHCVLAVDADMSTCPNYECQDKVPDVVIDKSLSVEQEAKLKALLQRYTFLFDQVSQRVGRTPMVKHNIITEGPPIRQKYRRVPQAMKQVVRDEVDKMLEKGVIRQSVSPWSSPIVLVRKKDGTWRFCVDFRKVNAVTHKDAYPLPNIEETLDSLDGAQYFSTLDLASGYWQVELEEEAKEKTAFATPLGLYEFNVMPFGLTNAPATFQRLMECVLAGLSLDRCLVYLDDVIVFSRSFDEHLVNLECVFERLAQAGLTLKLSKCTFCQKEVRYLGHIVGSGGIRPDPQKVSCVLSYPAPKNLKELQAFLGLANYYRRFIAHYSKIAAPLYQLTRKTAKVFVWTPACDAAFCTLKVALTSAPTLSYPCFMSPFILSTDASETAIGAVLSQFQGEEEHPVAYWSRQLQKAERNYSTIEREMLAVVAAVKHFYPYLYGRKFILFTDHHPLTTLKGLKDVGGCITRWVLFLQQFEIEFHFRAGTSNTNADAMSRLPPDSTVLPVITLDSEFNDIGDSQRSDPFLSDVIKALEEGRVPTGLSRQADKLFLKDGILCRKYRSQLGVEVSQLVVPRGLNSAILKQLHDRGGHLGVSKTLAKVKERYYWPGYEVDVEKWVRECQPCQRRNSPHAVTRAPLGTISANAPFEKLSWDITGPLPVTAAGHKYILVITDMFSKWVEAFPLQATDSRTLANVFVDQIVCRYGIPKSIHSDQGANLTSEIIQHMCSIFGMERTRTTAYHAQGNGLVERFNRTLKEMLAKVVKESQTDWDIQLPKVLLAYRTAIQDSTGFTPFRIIFGRTPTLPIDLMLPFPEEKGEEDQPSYSEYIKKLKHLLENAYRMVRQTLGASHNRQKEQYDKKTNDVKFMVGDMVYLHVPAVRQGGNKKLASRWTGPYTVVDKVSKCNLKIQLIGGFKSMVVHVNRLKPCYGTPLRKRVEKQSQKNVIPESLTGHTEVGGDPEAHEKQETSPNEQQSRPRRHCGPPVRFGDFVTY